MRGMAYLWNLGRIRRQILLVAVGAGVAVGMVLCGTTVEPASASEVITSNTGTRAVNFHSWENAKDFSQGQFDGVQVNPSGELSFASKNLTEVEYTDPHAPSVGAKKYVAGSWTSPVNALGFSASEAIASWNAKTDTGTWVKVEFRGQKQDSSWTKWFDMGNWTSGMDYDKGDIHRTSVDDQGDDDATVWTDTFSANEGHEIIADQVRITLLRPVNTQSLVTASLVGVMASRTDTPVETTSKTTMTEDKILPVPGFSQQIHEGEYPDFDGGGEAWCSPTSSTMVLYYWGKQPKVSDLETVQAPKGDPQVDWGAMHTYDFQYEGAGNWPFNTAYSASYGLRGFVTRLKDLTDAEKLIDADIPVTVSVAFTKDELPEAGYSTNGHLLVISGFTKTGDVVVNDPYSVDDAHVQRVYPRSEFEKVWLKSSGGTAYIVTPRGMSLPIAENGGGANNTSPVSPSASPSASPASTSPKSQSPVVSPAAEDSNLPRVTAAVSQSGQQSHLPKTGLGNGLLWAAIILIFIGTMSIIARHFSRAGLEKERPLSK